MACTLLMTSVLQEGENGNQTPLVSVTIPFFNASDESTTVARYFSERYSTILYLDMRDTLNKGVARSRNLRIGKTRGKYIATLDADDYGEPKKLTQQIALMEAHPELGMVRGTVRYWSSWAGGNDCIFQSGPVQTRVVYNQGLPLPFTRLGERTHPFLQIGC